LICITFMNQQKYNTEISYTSSFMDELMSSIGVFQSDSNKAREYYDVGSVICNLSEKNQDILVRNFMNSLDCPIIRPVLEDKTCVCFQVDVMEIEQTYQSTIDCEVCPHFELENRSIDFGVPVKKAIREIIRDEGVPVIGETAKMVRLVVQCLDSTVGIKYYKGGEFIIHVAEKFKEYYVLEKYPPLFREVPIIKELDCVSHNADLLVKKFNSLSERRYGSIVSSFAMTDIESRMSVAAYDRGMINCCWVFPVIRHGFYRFIVYQHYVNVFGKGVAGRYMEIYKYLSWNDSRKMMMVNKEWMKSFLYMNSECLYRFQELSKELVKIRGNRGFYWSLSVSKNLWLGSVGYDFDSCICPVHYHFPCSPSHGKKNDPCVLYRNTIPQQYHSLFQGFSYFEESQNCAVIFIMDLFGIFDLAVAVINTKTFNNPKNSVLCFCVLRYLINKYGTGYVNLFKNRKKYIMFGREVTFEEFYGIMKVVAKRSESAWGDLVNSCDPELQYRYQSPNLSTYEMLVLARIRKYDNFNGSIRKVWVPRIRRFVPRDAYEDYNHLNKFEISNIHPSSNLRGVYGYDEDMKRKRVYVREMESGAPG